MGVAQSDPADRLDEAVLLSVSSDVEHVCKPVETGALLLTLGEWLPAPCRLKRSTGTRDDR